MRRKFVSGKVIGVLAVLLIVFVAVGLAEEERTDAGRQWKYVLEDVGVTITGYVEEPSGDLVIPGELDGYPVTGIGDEAFYECWDLTSVTIPSGVKRIGDYAFSDCDALTSVFIPESVTSIGVYAFAECEALTSIHIPEGVTSIREGTFAYCGSLTDITIPSSVTRIGNSAFRDCGSLADITIPGSVTSIGNYAFALCAGITDITIPESVSFIGTNPFLGCKLTSIGVAPSNPVYEALDGVLFDKQQKVLVACPGAKEGEYAIPGGTLLIGNQAFNRCDGLTGVTIPDSVTDIGYGAFTGCKGLTSLIIPNSVMGIGGYAFSGTGLAGLTVPSSVTHIDIGSFSGLAAVTVPANLKIRAERIAIDGGANLAVANDERTDATGQWTYAPSDSGATIISYAGEQPSGDLLIPGKIDGYAITGIGSLAFSQCGGLTSVTIPDSVTTIGQSAFSSCNGLTGVTLPAGLTDIGDGAFSYCSRLIDIVIPDSVMRIGDNPFAGCRSLAEIHIDPSHPAYEVFDGVLFDKQQKTLVTCLAANTGEYAIPDGTLRIGYQAFSGCDKLTGITIPDSITHIGDYAFAGCRFANVTIPGGVSRIGDSVFRGCISLTRVTIPAGVTDIDYNAFTPSPNDYPNLTLVVARDSAAEDYAKTKRFPYVFDEAVGASDQWEYVLENGGATITGYVEEPAGALVIPHELDGHTVAGIGEKVFFWCDGLTSVVIPSGVTSIGAWAFLGCENLASVTLPASVASIGDRAFDMCKSLTSITLPESVTSMGQNPFASCPALTCIDVAATNPVFASIGGVLYDKQGETLVSFPAGLLDGAAYVIPQGTLRIGDYAFSRFDGLARVTIPDSVTSIGEMAFSECDNLVSVAILGSVTSIGDSAFCFCDSLTSITIPNGVTDIGNEAFADCSSLANLTLPASVTSIGEDAFRDCEKLILTVIEGSHAEQYAEENNIPYFLTQAATAETADELLIQQIDEFFTLPRAEIIKRLGSDYQDVPAGPEGACDGYYYEEMGMAFAFYPDSDALELIDCYPDFKIHGVGTGSLFSEIMKALGDTEIVETWLELPIYTAFMVQYRLGNADYSFIAFEKDGPVDILWIQQALHPDSGNEAR